MGVDLNLFPFDPDALEVGLYFAHSVLDVPRNYELFEAIRELQSFPVAPRDFSAYAARVRDGYHKGERCYGRVDVDAFGEPLRFVLAVQLVGPIVEHASSWRWGMAYVAALPPSTPIALYWH